MTGRIGIGLAAAALLAVCTCGPKNDTQNWTHFVRIGGNGLSLDRVDAIVSRAEETNVFGIETDNDIPGRYDSFLEPAEKLKAIAAVATKAHEAGNFSFVYIAGLECITANADKTERTFFKDHPDWVQRKRTGEPAVFGGGTAFWIDEGDEDIWCSPFPAEWRKIYMERVRQIAGTGIDGVYVDIPYWMTHFDGWEDSWASFDESTVAAFKEKTGLDAMTDFRLGDFSDPNFRKWVDFRIETLTDFMREIDENVKKANPQCKTIPEIYPGIGEEAVRVGADVYDMYPVVDAIAHEYSAGGYTSAERNPLDWFTYMEGMYAFRAFADGKASWMLSYSWDGEKGVDKREAMKNLFLSHVMAGTNTWDAQGHVMSGSNDMDTRKAVFGWIGEHEKVFYHPRKPMHPVGLYFSPKTRNYFADSTIRSFHGWMHLLLQGHVEFQIVTPRNRDGFSGDVLIFPDARCIDASEMEYINAFLSSGKTLVTTGETGWYDETGAKREANPVHAKLGLSDPGKEASGGDPACRFFHFPECPGRAYGKAAKADFDSGAWAGELSASLVPFFDSFKELLANKVGYRPAVTVDASPFVSTQIALVDGKPHVFLANFNGLKGNANTDQIPEKNVRVVFHGRTRGKAVLLPFLGSITNLPAAVKDGSLEVEIPEIGKGAVLWIE